VVRRGARSRAAAAVSGGLEFGVLGPLEVRRDGELVELPPPRAQAVLAVLLLRANSVVSADRLCEELWPSGWPDSARSALHVHVAAVRRALGRAALTTRAPGYLLELGEDQLDVWRFERAVRRGRVALAAGDARQGRAELELAISLWRGTPLASLGDVPCVRSEAARLEEERLTALEDRIEADLALGGHGELVGELAQLTSQHPYRERLHAQHMLVLYRAGRQADALAAYRHARTVLDAELGLEPGPELRRLEQAILHHDPSLRWPQGRIVERPSVPEFLPRPLRSPAGVPFVGRALELARLRELWSQAAGAGRVVFVAGEAGIGKTRLAAELAGSVHADGALVLYGRCDEGLAVPYQPFVEALGRHVRAVGPDRVGAELGRVGSDLAWLLPELEVLGRPVGADPETERFRLFEAVAALVEAATREQPALLVLDDLHWAAGPTLLLLRHLIRADRPLRVLVLGTYRMTELDPVGPLAQLLADVQRDARAPAVRINGLDTGAIADLLEAAAGHPLAHQASEFVDALRTATAGNPFFVRELLADLVESGAIDRDGERWTADLAAAALGVPEGVRQVIGQRVARLSERARRALAVAAVAGQTFSLSVLEAVISDESGMLDGLDEAVSAGLLTEAGRGEYAFAHALVRQTIYEGHGAARRMRLHRRLGEALEARPDAEAYVEALAHHFAQAAPDGQATKAAIYALAAGRKAAAGVAYADAAERYEQGLNALELAAVPPEELRGELLLALAAARWSAGDMDKAREACRLAAELADQRGDADQLARAALSFAGPARLEVSPGATERTVDLLERALASLEERNSALRARVMSRLAAVLSNLAPGRRRPALAYRALEMARRVGDQRALVDVLSNTLWATWSPDNLDERRATANELVQLATDEGKPALEALARWSLVTALLERGEIDDAEYELAAQNRRAEALQRRHPLYLAAIARAAHAHLKGRLEEYEALAHEARALALKGQDESATQMFGMQLFFLRREQGRLDELIDDVRCFVEQYAAIPAWRCALALIYAELNRPRDARRELDWLARSDFAALPRDLPWLSNIAIVSDVVAILDDARRADLLYRQLVPFADRYVVRGAVCMGSVSRPLGVLATTMGRFDASTRHFQDALQMNAKIRSPLWIAHTQHEYARTLLRLQQPGDREHASELLRAALATADKLGLKTLADRALRLTRKTEASRSRTSEEANPGARAGVAQAPRTDNA
jgi:DNA-binding SARP family transcriptional activator